MIGIVFPHQCFKDIPKEWDEIRFIRHDIGYGGKHTTVKNFHIARKVFLRACEFAWIEAVEKKGLKITVIKRGKSWYTKEKVECWDPVDHMLESEIRKHCQNVTILDSPAFLLSSEDALITLGDKEHDSHAAFYASMRTKFDILMTKGGKPEGGKFRFDTENRKKIGKDVKLPDWEEEIEIRQSKFVKAAADQLKSEGEDGPGVWTGDVVFPTTHEGAKKALERFVAKRLKQFGPYEDAVVEDEDFLFHSVLSAPINVGLLTPADVLETVLPSKGKVPIESLEGFIAQILGWREFMRAVYLKRPGIPKNRLDHKKSLSPAWYEGKTGLLPVDTAIQRVNENAYLHHIERLMIVGNAMFLAEIRPVEVYRWFMEMFADSWDWVMVGNVYYMSQWTSDAITTKPYISSSAYVLRMSDYKRGEWCDVWDALYWNTVRRLGPLLRKNYRMAAQVAFWEKKSAAEKREIQERANKFLH